MDITDANTHARTRVMLPPKDFLALHAPSGHKTMKKMGVFNLDDLFAVVHQTMNAEQTLPHEVFAVAPPHAVFKGQLFHFLKVNLPGVGFLLADAIKANRVLVGGKRKGNREWVSLIPLESDAPPLLPAFDANYLTCPITCDPFVDPHLLKELPVDFAVYLSGSLIWQTTLPALD